MMFICGHNFTQAADGTTYSHTLVGVCKRNIQIQFFMCTLWVVLQGEFQYKDHKGYPSAIQCDLYLP